MEEVVGGRHAPPAFDRGLVRHPACAGDAFPSCRSANGYASAGVAGWGRGGRCVYLWAVRQQCEWVEFTTGDNVLDKRPDAWIETDD